MNFSPEFSALRSAEAAFGTDNMNLTKLAALEVAERAYFEAVSAARTKWEGLDITDNVRASADLNANDTVAEGNIHPADEVEFFRIAIASVDFVETI